MTNVSPTSTSEIADALRLEALEELAELAISYWRSVAEAAYRHEPHVAAIHCRQISAVTREAFSLVKSIGGPASPDA